MLRDDERQAFPPPSRSTLCRRSFRREANRKAGLLAPEKSVKFDAQASVLSARNLSPNLLWKMLSRSYFAYPEATNIGRDDIEIASEAKPAPSSTKLIAIYHEKILEIAKRTTMNFQEVNDYIELTPA